MINHPYSAWLDKVGNPSQYLGGEKNSVIKDASEIICRFGLCFPELYQIGMSNLGIKILYSIINSKENLWAERFFAPEPDMEEILRSNNEPLRSLESRDPLSAFDIVGFSITTESCFTEILAMLDLGGVPLLQKDRDDSNPFVIGGGPSVYNPEPVSEFFDLFVLGEAEEVLPKICELVGAGRKNGVGRTAILKQLAEIEGVYVPSLFEAEYDGYKIKSINPIEENLPKPKRVYLDDINKSPYPFDMVIPYGQPVFDRLSVEIDRGCTQGCRFCQAGITYRPVREREPGTVAEIVEKGLKSTGFDDVSLASLSSGDYGNIDKLVKDLMNKTEKEKIAISLPSMRSGTLTSELIGEIGRVRKTGFTITAEAGNERLRNVINKKIPDAEIIATAEKVLEGGWRNLKLYFMIGLPTETDEDVYSIVDLVKRIRNLKTANGRRFSAINVGVAQFVPKSFTAFQWVPMVEREELLRRKKLLIGAFKKMKNVSLRGHEVEMSFIEGVFARGDRRLGKVIMKAYEKGCRLDGWGEYFRYDFWMDSFKECDIEPEEFANRKREIDETLPWDHLNIGVSKKYLAREFSLSEQEEATADCRTGDCLACGLNKKFKVKAELMGEVESAKPLSAPFPEETARYRISFRKEGLARYLSHLELKTGFARAVKRAGLPVAYSEGMHPHPKFHFGPAVSVGISSLCEFIDVDICGDINEDDATAALNEQLETGVNVYRFKKLQLPYKSIQAATIRTIFRVYIDEKLSNGISPLDIKSALSDQEGIEITEKDEEGRSCLEIATTTPGILSKIRKTIPEFMLGPGIEVEKAEVVMREPLRIVSHA